MDIEVQEGIVANTVRLFTKTMAAASTNLLLKMRNAYQLGFDPQMEVFIASNEQARVRAYIVNMTRRLETALENAILNADHETVEDRKLHWEQAIKREYTYVTAHIDAVAKRLSRAQELGDVHAKSPLGALWVLGTDVKQHTPDCLAMGGKAWSWPVLLAINPYTRHYGCKCHIEPLPTDFPTNQINNFIPAVVQESNIFTVEEATTYSLAKKAFGIMSRGAKRAEYTATSKLELMQRRARQDANLGGHFISIGGHPIFVSAKRAGLKGAARRANIGRGKPNLKSLRPTVAKPSTKTKGATQRLDHKIKQSSSDPVRQAKVPDDGDISYQEAAAIGPGHMFNEETLRSTYTGKFTTPLGDIHSTVDEIVNGTSSDTSGSPFYTVSGRFLDAKYGSLVGTFRRYVYNDSRTNVVTVLHDYINIDSEIQGQGLVERFNHRAETFYRVNGVDEIRLTANIDVGGYAWAKAGYSFSSGSSAKEVLKEAKEGLLHPSTFTGKKEDRRTLYFDSMGEIESNIHPSEYYNYEEVISSGEIQTPYQLSQLGYDGTHWDHKGHDMWYGKALMMGSSWLGIKHIHPISEQELQAVEAATEVAPEGLSDFAIEMILASMGRNTLDEYQVGRIIDQVHYLWVLNMEGRASKFDTKWSGDFEKRIKEKKSVYNQHHFDMGASPEDDKVYWDAVDKAISGFDALLKAAVPAGTD